jgi:hypothetical protein
LIYALILLRNNIGIMMRFISKLPMFFMAGLAACAVAPPSGPTVTALPGPGKSLDQFQQDDDQCRNYAASRTQNAPQEAADASNNANATAVAGTLIGAAAGAALGSLSGNVGAGAAVGAGAGLLAGASTAGDQAQGAADSLQQQYDTAYEQCMVGNGEALNAPPPPGYGGGGYGGGPDAADTVVPAAIATGAAAAILLSNRPDHDDGYRPDNLVPGADDPTRKKSDHVDVVHDAAASVAAPAAPAVDDPTKKKDKDKKKTSS